MSEIGNYVYFYAQNAPMQCNLDSLSLRVHAKFSSKRVEKKKFALDVLMYSVSQESLHSQDGIFSRSSCSSLLHCFSKKRQNRSWLSCVLSSLDVYMLGRCMCTTLNGMLIISYENVFVDVSRLCCSAVQRFLCCCCRWGEVSE